MKNKREVIIFLILAIFVLVIGYGAIPRDAETPGVLTRDDPYPGPAVTQAQPYPGPELTATSEDPYADDRAECQEAQDEGIYRMSCCNRFGLACELPDWKKTRTADPYPGPTIEPYPGPVEATAAEEKPKPKETRAVPTRDPYRPTSAPDDE